MVCVFEYLPHCLCPHRQLLYCGKASVCGDTNRGDKVYVIRAVRIIRKFYERMSAQLLNNDSFAQKTFYHQWRKHATVLTFRIFPLKIG